MGGGLQYNMSVGGASSPGGEVLGAPALSPLSHRCFICPVKRMKQTQDDSLPFRVEAPWFVLKARWRVSKLWRRALPCHGFSGQAGPVQPQLIPGNRPACPVRLPGHIQPLPVLTVPQSAISYTPSEPGDTEQLQTVHSGELNSRSAPPGGSAQARSLVPAHFSRRMSGQGKTDRFFKWESFLFPPAEPLDAGLEKHRGFL